MRIDRLTLCAVLLREWARALERTRDLGPAARALTCPYDYDPTQWRCGTTCCAWGYLAAREEIKKMGAESYPDREGLYDIWYGGARAFQGIALFFDADLEWASAVFGAHRRDGLRAVARDLDMAAMVAGMISERQDVKF